MICWVFASALAISGGSASSGSRSTVRATRSRTSFAAASISRCTSNSTVTWELPSRLAELMVRMPSMPAMESSTSCVIFVSTTCAEAPG